LTAAIDTIAKSIVKIGEYGDSNSNSGLGIVVNSHGTVMTDKSVIYSLNNDGITYPNGKSYRAAIIQSQTNGDLVFLVPLISAAGASSTSFVPASISNFPKLGETIASLGGNDVGTLGIGVVDGIVTSGASSTPSAVSTTIAPGKVLPGSPVFDISGGIIGIRTSSLYSASGTQFYLISPIKAAFPK
jgi:hypothetical protein